MTLTNQNLYVSTWSTATETWARELITSGEVVSGLGLTYDCKGNLYGLYLDHDSRFHILHGVDAGENLVTDASFESPLPLRAKPMNFVRHDIPSYYTNIGIISKAGESRSYYVPGYPGTTAMNTWIGHGESTPWVRITPYLKRGRYMVHKNRLRLCATRSTHVTGYVTEHITGRVEFSVGDNRETISDQIITIDKDGARFWLTANGDIASHPDEIRSAWEYFNASRIAVDAHMEIHPPIEHIEMTADLALDPEVDDNDLYESEVEMLLDMGFNNLYVNGPNTDKEGLGLLSESGIHIWSLHKKTDGCYNQPDTYGIDSKLEDIATTWAGKTDRVIRSKDGYELMANSIEHVVECSVCQGKFRDCLREDLGLSLAELGIKNWWEALPTGHAGRNAYPALYYYTHMFRFDSFRKMAKMCQKKLST